MPTSTYTAEMWTIKRYVKVKLKMLK